jgi:hypothetical protein
VNGRPERRQALVEALDHCFLSEIYAGRDVHIRVPAMGESVELGRDEVRYMTNRLGTSQSRYDGSAESPCPARHNNMAARKIDHRDHSLSSAGVQSNRSAYSM